MVSEAKIAKDFKLTEAGIIPKDWTVEKLKNLSTDIGDGIHATPQYVDTSDYFFINGNNLVENSIVINDKTKCISQEEYQKYKIDLNEQTILLSINGTIGNVAFFHNEKVVLGKSAAYINLKNGVPKNFIFYLLQSYGVNRYFEDELTGTTIRNLSLKSIRDTPIPLPPLPEQQAIAEALSDVDALITSLDQLIAKKHNIKQGAMQELLTGKKRLSEFETKPDTKQTEVGILPGDWEIIKLGEVCQIFGRIGFRGYTKGDIVEKGTGAIAISPSNIQASRTDFTNCTYISWPKYEESPEIKIFNGDILLVKTGSTFGKTAIVQNLPEKATLNPQVVVLKKAKVSNSFLGYMMSFKTIQDQITSTIVGGALPTLSQKVVADFKLPIPPTEAEQQAIGIVLSDMDAEIEVLEQQREKYKAIKQGMMQELLTGRVRLNRG